MQDETWQLDAEWRKQIQNALGDKSKSRICLLGNSHRLPELADEEADLLVVFVQLLARSGQPHERAFLTKIAAQPAQTPNREFIRDAAVAFVAPTALAADPIPQRGYALTTPATVTQTVYSASRRP